MPIPPQICCRKLRGDDRKRICDGAGRRGYDLRLLQEVNGCTDETILWLGEPMPPKAARKFFKCYPDFDAITDKLKYLLLSAHSRSRKSYEYSEKLVNGLKILSLIRKRPGISTQTLTELTELPLRSVQRYISALQATGEWIEYDRSLRGWKLFHGFSTVW